MCQTLTVVGSNDMATILNLSKFNITCIERQVKRAFVHRKFSHFNSRRPSISNCVCFINQTQQVKIYIILEVRKIYYISFQSSTSNKEPKTEKVQISGGILSTPFIKTPSVKPGSQPVRGCFHPGASALSRETIPLQSGQTVTGTQMIQAMLKYIWPRDDKSVRDRVKVALSLLVGAKLLNVTVPFIFKYSVDYLNQGGNFNMETAPETVATVVTSLLLGCK